jgi:hypothetical protein
MTHVQPVQFCLPVIMLNQCTNSLLSVLVESAFFIVRTSKYFSRHYYDYHHHYHHRRRCRRRKGPQILQKSTGHLQILGARRMTCSQMLMKLAASSVAFEGSRLGKRIPCRSHTKGKSRRATIQGSQSNLRCAARERFGPTTVSSVRK